MPANVSSACSSCSIAGRSRWFVGSSSTRQLTPRAESSASDARVRSPGESESAGRVTWSAPRPNLASSERTSFVHEPARRLEAREQRLGSRRTRRAPGRARRRRRPGRDERRRRRAAAARARRRAASSCRCRCCRGSRPARRSGSRDRSGPSVNVAAVHDRAGEARDHRAAARRGRDLHAEVPALPRLVDRVRLEPFERPVGDLGLGRDVLAAVAAEVADELVGLAALRDLGLALHRPLPLLAARGRATPRAAST